MNRFQNKTAIVTGAASGIGAATARRLAEEGANVVLADVSDDDLKRVAKAFEVERTLTHVADVADQSAVEGLVRAAVERFGGLDVIVNNAGVGADGTAEDVTLEDYRKVMAINVDGVFFGCRAALPHLKTSRGCIVNTASISGLGGDGAMTAYDMSKGAVVQMTRAIARDYGRHGVRVNAVAPSLIRTGLTDDIEQNRPLMKAFEDTIPMKRIGEADEVAAAIAFLASDDASFISGVILSVDGGLFASNGQPDFADFE